MAALHCEMCGGSDLIKQDGVFVCQNCGCKYTVEEAKKMMIEGTVDVSGSTVKVDTSIELANLYQIARRAKNDNNSENAAKYYDMILVKDPTSWEAAFYVVYFQAMSCKIAGIRSAAISVSNCEDSVLALIKDNVPEAEQYDAVKEMMDRCSIVANMLASGAKNHYDGISLNIKNGYTQEYVNNVCSARDIMYDCGTYIDRIFGEKENIAKLSADAWKDGIAIHQKILPFLSNVVADKAVMSSFLEKIGKYDPMYSYRERKISLENDLSSLNSQLKACTVHGESNTKNHKIYIWVGAMLFVIGALIFEFSPLSFMSVWMIVLGGTLLFVGLIKTEREKKQNRFEILQLQIKNKQKELDELEQQMKD